MTREAPVDRSVVTAGTVLTILLLAANLRAGISGVGPLLPAIEAETGLSSGWSGLLNTLPPLTFAAVSPFVPRVAALIGAHRLLIVTLAALAAGTVVRSLPWIVSLFLGTLLMSVATAHGNVLLPAVVRQQIPTTRISAISAQYVAAMGAAAALCSGVVAPLAGVLPGGWRSALAILLLLTLPSLWVCARQMRSDERASPPPLRTAIPWRSALAWQITFFTGLQSFLFFTVVAWLPSIGADHGIGAAGGLAPLLLPGGRAGVRLRRAFADPHPA